MVKDIIGHWKRNRKRPVLYVGFSTGTVTRDYPLQIYVDDLVKWASELKVEK